MKNLILFIVLVALATFTYYFDELEEIKNNLEEDRQSKLFSMRDLGELKGIKTAVTEFFKISDQYFTGKHHRLVDIAKMEKFLDILSHLRIRRVLNTGEMDESKKKNYFSENNYRFDFIFSGGKVSYLIGKKLNFDQSFYVEVEKNGKKKWLVAFDASPETGIYRKDNQHRSDRKYQRLIRLCLLKEDFFYDLSIFKKKFERKSWEFGELINKKNKSYQINFSDNVIEPNCPEGISTDLASVDQFISNISGLIGQQIYYPYRKKLLKKWVSTLKLRDFDGKKYHLNLYKRYGSLKGYFLKNSFSENLYELDSNVAKMLFTPHQNFCNLRPPFYEVGGAKREVFFDIDFKNGTTFNLYIPWQERFEVNMLDEKGDYSPNNVSFKALFDFFSAKAERVTTNLKDTQKLMPRASFTISYLDQSFFVIHERNEILLLSLKHKYLLHYPVSKDLPIGLEMNDYFLKDKT